MVKTSLVTSIYNVGINTLKSLGRVPLMSSDTANPDQVKLAEALKQ